MSASRLGALRLPLGRTCFASPSRVHGHSRIRYDQLCGQFCQQHNQPQKRDDIKAPRRAPRHASRPGSPLQANDTQYPSSARRTVPIDGIETPSVESLGYEFSGSSIPKVRYLRPAIWALVVSSGLFVGFSYLEAKRQVQAQNSSGWLQVPQIEWRPQRQTMPSPTEVATRWWKELDPVSKTTYGIIGANTMVHASSFLVPGLWDRLWHLPARNVNYSLFTSMFVHSGAMHFFVNMYCLNNFMAPVGYSRLFEGSPYHILSFFLTTGVLSGFAQHWSTLLPIQKRAIPEVLIRCGGASGALFGVLGAFCMQYPTAGLGIIFVPVHFDAQYVLPAIMLFDLVGIVRGYSFVNFGHAVCASQSKEKTSIADMQ